MGTLSPIVTACVSTLVPLGLAGAYFLSELGYVAMFTPRLPEAPGPTKGLADESKGSEGSKGKALRMVCIGDSVAAGCGLTSNEEACAGTFARHLSKHSGRPVSWRVIGRNGYEAARIEKNHVKRIPGNPDVVVLSVGVNNLLAMQSDAVFKEELRSLLSAIRAKVGEHSAIILLGMPPMSMFVALTPLLKRLAGAKAKAFNGVMAKVCSALPGTVIHVDYTGPGINDLVRREMGTVPSSLSSLKSFFAPDGFHPGPLALDFMATLLFETYEIKCRELEGEVDSLESPGEEAGHLEPGRILQNVSFVRKSGNPAA
ncbi:hypothetical protein HOP50_16g76730 [Chloropicon primus]|uniref:SGNH hydrolase-type esterase domain-containing protein n=1 Tax=Chloropicon primus TaxID=1764295 RepID=A0A5B8MYE6_9CHLO|nr:hypothetical protein A3770_16p76440 [Chloropicon primus]UPR04335.1 hypothetical protein HOP50_16g76730 [Chloropicon primus]|eukprot:QDZ25126.1 hypothetical protein A3770_16p76440 [Chloropicon primus]